MNRGGQRPRNDKLDAHKLALFRGKVEKAVEAVRAILTATRKPVWPGEVGHAYDDKYRLALLACGAAVAAELQALGALGLTAEKLTEMRKWRIDGNEEVTLRLTGSTECKHVGEEKRMEVVMPATKTTKTKESAGFVWGGSCSSTSVETEVKQEVTEQRWALQASWRLVALRGDEKQELVLSESSENCSLVTSTKASPLPAATTWPVQQLSLGWLLEQLQKDGRTVAFDINRLHPKCLTPRRNPDVDAAVLHFRAAAKFATEASNMLRNRTLPGLPPGPGHPDKNTRMGLPDFSASAGRLFVPVLPLFALEQLSSTASDDGGCPPEKGGAATAADVAVDVTDGESLAVDAALPLPADGEEGVTLTQTDLGLFLQKQRESLAAERLALDTDFASFEAEAAKRPDRGSGLGLASTRGAFAYAVLGSLARIGAELEEVVDAVEGLLGAQLVAAVGKELSTSDFTEYMDFHAQKMFAPEYSPLQFCFSVRRPALPGADASGHAPEGTLSILESQGFGKESRPINTLTMRASAPPPPDADGTGAAPMRFRLSAAVEVPFYGERYLHGFVPQTFAGSNPAPLTLEARARQFSCFVLMVGTIKSATEFEPTAAVLVKDKDELRIPLMLSTLPTPKEFRDAIESLSPAQQRFCKAFRSFQLSSTVFGVLVVQVKPQLEELLNLAPGALTKEIRLTQDLLELFIKYQLPSHLLSFGGDDDTPSAERLAEVRAQVDAMKALIAEEKEREVAEHKRQLQLNRQTLHDSDHSEDEEEVAEFSCEAEEAAAPSPRMLKKKGRGPMGGMMMRRGGDGGGGPAARAFAPSAMNAMPMARSAASSSFGAAPVAFGAAPVDNIQAAPMAPSPFGAASPQFGLDSSAAPPAKDRSTADKAPPQSSKTERAPESPGGPAEEDEPMADLSALPKRLDDRFLSLGAEAEALRATVVKPALPYMRNRAATLLGRAEPQPIGSEEASTEKAAAFDLLDALSRGGELPMHACELHVMLAATHTFDASLVETVVQRDENPIESLERSLCALASVVYGGPCAERLLAPEFAARLQAASPALFPQLPDGSHD